MNIVYVFDDNFAVCAAVSMTSLMENNKDVEDIHFYIFDDGIKDDSKHGLNQLCERYHASITYIDVKQVTARLETLGVEPWRGRYSAYIKLMVGSFLPEKMSRAIVIDADTIVAGSIAELETMDLQGHPCAMALEGIPGEYNEICGLGNAELYNTGVIVYDLQAWREKRVEERFVQHLTTVRSRYLLPEEVPISIVLKDDIERLAPCFNFIAQFHFYGTKAYFRRFHWDRLGDKFYAQEEIENAKRDVRIYHCIDTFTSRPWFRENVHPYTPYYDTYLAMTPWKDIPKREQNLSGVAKVEYLLRKYLPQSLSDYMYYVACKLFYTVKAKRFYRE